MKFKIVEILKGDTTFTVMVEYPNLKREGFTFPRGQGWEKKVNGEPKFITNIKNRLKEREENLKNEGKEINEIDKLVGKEF